MWVVIRKSVGSMPFTNRLQNNPTTLHATLHSATTESERLANLNVGEEFQVFALDIVGSSITHKARFVNFEVLHQEMSSEDK